VIDILGIIEIIRPFADRTCPEWCEENIDLSCDPTAANDVKMFELARRPHLREPLEFFSRDHGGKMTVVGVEQLGKSTIWKLGLIYGAVNNPQPALIVYPSEDLGMDENRDSLEPLMRGVPHLAKLLDQPFSRKRDSYRLGRAIIYFTGAGNPVISKRAATVIGDEVNSWPPHEGRVDNVKRLDHRGRSFRDPRRVLVCSPTGSGGLIWREFKQSSMGYWTLRCQGCGELTMRSCDIAGKFHEGQRRGGLQFEVEETDENAKRAVPGTIRLVCPECEHEHTEDQSAIMNQQGGYVHKVAALVSLHAGYQFGALANIPHYFPKLSWLECANAQLKAGSSGTLSDQQDFDNSWRGLPYRPRKHLQDGQDFEMQLRVHVAELPDPSKIWFRVIGVDTQDESFWWVCRGVDKEGNSYRLGYGQVTELEDIVRLLGTKFHGDFPLVAMQDVKGHREKEVVPKLNRVHGMLMYRGTGVIRDKQKYLKWKRFSPKSKIYYAAARQYQADLLYKIHTQLDRTKPYWYLPPEIGSDYAHHILAMQPAPRKRDGDQYENWEAVGDQDHLFDCEKIILVAIDIVHAHMRVAKSKGLDPMQAVMAKPVSASTPTFTGRRQIIKNYD
jgi:hypothetical protein